MKFLSGLTERHLILALCLAAALRVFIYAAAFPFFDNVDEGFHFDIVLKYAHGHVMRGFEPMSAGTSNYVAMYASPEYRHKPGEEPGKKFAPPLWTQAGDQIVAAKSMANIKATFVDNPESSQPPLYYALAALWLHLGRTFGLAGGFAIYWIRFLNIPLAAGVTWLGYDAARLVFPGSVFLRRGVPALLAALPQDAFYSIQSDVLSPLLFGLGFIGVLKFFHEAKPSARLGRLTGLSLAGACLVKPVNLPLAAVALAAVLAETWRRRGGGLGDVLPYLGRLLPAAVIPVLLWMSWNLGHYGDLTGSMPKIAMLGWTPKPLGAWFDHPLFTPGGLGYFWSHLIASLWRGEIVWGLERLASQAGDIFYWASTSALLAAAALGLPQRFAPELSTPQREALLFSFCCFFALVAAMVPLSIAFDFGACEYPSRAAPYFVSGRLLAGALIPFFLLYLYGLEWAARGLWHRFLAGPRGDVWADAWIGRLLWALLAVTLVIMTGAQFAADRVVFSSPWNWYHMLQAPPNSH